MNPKMNNRVKTISYDTKARIFWALSTVSIISLSVYVYAVLATVYNTVEREDLVSESADLYARVSELEYKGLALRKTVDLELALSRGFAEVRNPVYVSRDPASLTLNTEKR